MRNASENKKVEGSNCDIDKDRNKGFISSSYNRYFSSGHYKSRYPRVNHHTFTFIQRYLDKEQHRINVLDYGCGDGRYLINLLQHYPNIYGTAYDIAEASLNLLRESLTSLSLLKRVTLVDDFQVLKRNIKKQDEENNSLNLALLLFGVLSHIPLSSQRHAVLVFLRENIGSGYLVLSVPNKKRRFLSLQKQQNSQDITYTRKLNDQEISLSYHLYSLKSIQQELSQAQLNIVKIRAESLMPESWITRLKLLGWIDYQLCKIVPAQWGYGILICCKSNQASKVI